MPPPALPAPSIMTALLAIITFFFIHVLLYVAISAVLAAAAWWMGRQAAKAKNTDRMREIEGFIDKTKERAFIISLALTFFFIAPFVVIYLFVLG